jgi:CRISPR-associated endonuclease/helicase Cas3
MARSILIFDEIQTLPVRCVHLVNNALNFLVEQCGSSIVLCTATQPLLDGVDPGKGALRLASASSIIPDEQLLFEALRRVEIEDLRKPGGWKFEEIAQFATRQVEENGNCLVILNTKDAAKRTFNAIPSTAAPDAVFHLSTMMCPSHRRATFREITQRLQQRLPVLCVSTQLIEAGVDIDFASVIRSLAGLDSIAQAAGRCNRNGLRTAGRVHLVDAADENLKRLTDIRHGRDVALWLLDNYRENPDRYPAGLFGPDAIREYYQRYFFRRSDEMSYPLSPEKLGYATSLLDLLSRNTTGAGQAASTKAFSADSPFRQAFMSAAESFQAIDSATIGVIVPYGDEGRETINALCAAPVERQLPLLRKAQQFTVNVFQHVIAELGRLQAIYPIQQGSDTYYLDHRYYDDRFGLTVEPVRGLETLYEC